MAVNLVVIFYEKGPNIELGLLVTWETCLFFLLVLSQEDYRLKAILDLG